MKEQPDQRKQLLYYCVLVVIVMLLLNIFVFPALLQPQVTEVTYDGFLSMVDDGSVEEVSYQDSMLVFTAKASSSPRRSPPRLLPCSVSSFPSCCPWPCSPCWAGG